MTIQLTTRIGAPVFHPQNSDWVIHHKLMARWDAPDVIFKVNDLDEALFKLEGIIKPGERILRGYIEEDDVTYEVQAVAPGEPDTEFVQAPDNEYLEVCPL